VVTITECPAEGDHIGELTFGVRVIAQPREYAREEQEGDGSGLRVALCFAERGGFGQGRLCFPQPLAANISAALGEPKARQKAPRTRTDEEPLRALDRLFGADPVVLPISDGRLFQQELGGKQWIVRQRAGRLQIA
jgi:hypothetical protein